MKEPTDKRVKAHAIESILAMDMIKDTLDEEAFAYSIKEHKDTPYDGLSILRKGYAAFFAEERDKKKVRTIIKHIKSLPYVAYSKD